MWSRIQYETGTGTHIVGRNMDWTEKMGTNLYVFPKGIARQGLAKVNPAPSGPMTPRRLGEQ